MNAFEDNSSNFAERRGGEKQFGLVLGGIAIIWGSISGFAHGFGGFNYSIITVGSSLVIAGLFFESWLIVPNGLWNRLGHTLARAVSPIVLAALFFGPVLVIGLLMQIFKVNAIYSFSSDSRESAWSPRLDEDYKNLDNQY